MAIYSRFAQIGQRKQTVYLSLFNLERIGQTVRDKFASSRRATISSKRLGRVLSAMIARRLEPTDSTPYSRQFDVVVASLSAVVPSVMNEIIVSVPLAGSTQLSGEQVNCKLLKRDIFQIGFYINSPLFQEDLQVISNFAQAQAIAMVQINTFLPFVQPSVMLRAAKGGFLSSITLPYKLRTAYYKVKSENAGGLCEVKFTKPAIIGEVSAKGEPEELPAATESASESRTEVPVELDPNHEHYNEDEYNYHFTGTDDSITTISKALGVLLPMFIIVDDLTAPDWLDVISGTKVAAQYSDTDLTYTVDSATTYFTRHLAMLLISKSNESKLDAGLVDQRSPSKTQIPGLGTDFDNPLNQQLSEQKQSTDYSPGPRESQLLRPTRPTQPAKPVTNPPGPAPVKQNPRKRGAKASALRDLDSSTLLKVLKQLIK